MTTAEPLPAEWLAAPARSISEHSRPRNLTNVDLPRDPSLTQRLLEPFKPVRDRLKPHEALSRGLAGIAVAYGAVLAAVARRATPGDPNWTSSDAALIAALAAVLVVLAYAAFEVMDDHFTDAEAEEAKQLRQEVGRLGEDLSAERKRSERRRRIRDLDRDMNGSCRAIINEIHASLQDATGRPLVGAHAVSAHLWLCNHETDLFVRRWSFVLREHRGRSGIEWGKGKGVAGWAWKEETPKTESLAPLHAAQAQGRRAFGRLSEEKRFGLTYEEVSRTGPAGYTGIIARLIYPVDDRASSARSSKLLAVFGLDYSGDEALFDQLDVIINSHSVRGILGVCESRLTVADTENILWSSTDD